ncbi:MAG: hypothetical protein EAZ92_00640 [Candidatus Kapaibacterium sp.]|nr:MAG: hypothetical protein EAZ92_00640 [Candidatus Kapabacteria bacterium]
MAEQTDTQIFNRADQISSESQPGGNTKTRVGGLFRDMWETLVARLSQKANATEVTSALAAKANLSDVNTALAAKANTADVNTALAAKADASALNTLASVVATKPDEQDITDAVTAEATARAAADAALLQQIEDLPSGDYLPLEGNSLASPIAGDVFLEGDKKLVFAETVLDIERLGGPTGGYVYYYPTRTGKYLLRATLLESINNSGGFLQVNWADSTESDNHYFGDSNTPPNNVAPDFFEKELIYTELSTESENSSANYIYYGGNGDGSGKMRVELIFIGELSYEDLRPQDLGLVAKTTTEQMSNNGQGGAFGVGESIIYDFGNPSQKLFGIKEDGYYFYLDGSYYNNGEWGFNSSVYFGSNRIAGSSWSIEPNGEFMGLVMNAQNASYASYVDGYNVSGMVASADVANTANQANSANSSDVAYGIWLGDNGNWWITNFWDGGIGAIQIRKNYPTETGLPPEDKVWVDNNFNFIADTFRTADSGYSDPTVSAPSKAALTDSSTLADVLNYLASIHNALKSKNIIST